MLILQIQSHLGIAGAWWNWFNLQMEKIACRFRTTVSLPLQHLKPAQVVSIWKTYLCNLSLSFTLKYYMLGNRCLEYLTPPYIQFDLEELKEKHQWNLEGQVLPAMAVLSGMTGGLQSTSSSYSGGRKRQYWGLRPQLGLLWKYWSHGQSAFLQAHPGVVTAGSLFLCIVPKLS